jgi:hypothetical protein
MVFGQNEINFLKTPDVNERVLINLFEGKFDKENNSITWHPNPKESFPIGEYGETCKKLDTVINFSANDKKYSLYVFKSLAIDSGVILESNADVPTMSLALFENKNDSINLLALNKNVCKVGQMGLFGKLEIVRLGTAFYALSVEEEDYKETDRFTTFYSINEWFFGKEVFTCPNWIVISYSEMPIYQRTTVKVQKPKSLDVEFYDLIITTTQFKPTVPKETVLKHIDKSFKFNGRRWDNN